eukprot:Transcript_15157.p1 GENE.Transcript_15157~~Transcript_15157.p1  ORF type:complete len:331 (+),score=102.11 Transcript_15157:93-995(+)
MATSTWRKRARSSLPLAADGTRAGDHAVWGLATGGGEPSAPPVAHVRMPKPAAKKPVIDLGASLEGGMFGALVEMQPDPPHVGTAWLCFLAPNTFVGVAEVAVGGRAAVTVQLTGTEVADECTRELCGADDCCGDTAFGVKVVDPRRSRRPQRSFVARSTGLGDYAAFEGRGFAFQSDRVPTGAERALLLAEHFRALREVRGDCLDDAVLCQGPIEVDWSADQGPFTFAASSSSPSSSSPSSSPPTAATMGAAAAATGASGGGSPARDQTEEGEDEEDAGLAPRIAAVAVPPRRGSLRLL